MPDPDHSLSVGPTADDAGFPAPAPAVTPVPLPPVSPADLSAAASAPPAGSLEAERLLASLRQAQEQFDRCFNLTSVGHAMIDLETGRFLRVNRRLCELTGYREEELLERTVCDITHPEDRAGEEENLRSYLRGEIEEHAHEKRYVRRDGAIVWVEVSGTSIHDEEGRLARMVSVIQDITGRKRTEAELRRALDRVNGVLESITEAYFALDAEFRFVEVNPAAIRLIFQRPAAELLGRGFWEVFPTGRDSEFDIRYHEAMREQRPVHFEAHSKIVDRWFEVHATPRDGRLEVHFRDVSDRKRAEAALRESEDRLKLALDAAEAGYWDWNFVTGRIEWSETYYRQLGFPLEMTPTREAISSIIHPEDVERVREAMAGSRRTGATFSTEFRIRHSSLGERWISISGRAVLDGAGQAVRMSGISLDITERKRAEDELRRVSVRSDRLFEYNLIGLLVARLSGEILEANDAFLRIIGYTREDLAAGRLDWRKLTPPEYHAHGREVTSELLRDGVGTPFQKEYLRKDGTRVPVMVGVALLDNREEEVAYVLDLSERKQLEDALRQRIDALAEADRRKDEFLAMLAHELRNPLAPILNAVTILRLKGPDDPLLRRHQEIIARQVDHMRRLLDDLLDVSRVTRGKIELKRAPVALATVLSQAVEACRPMLEGRRHEFSLSLPPGTMRVDADLTRLVQVFTNLLNNAAKYTEPGGHIHVVVEREGDTAVVRVIDNGIGMTAEMLEHAFDLFTQADQSLDRSQGGLGIGLTMVRSLVEMHGGSVTARSEGPGKGSELEVRLQLIPELAGEMVAGGAGSIQRGPGPGACRVLVVDDNPDAAESLAMLIGLWHHETRVAFDGPSAIETALELRPEAILIDIGLPGMSGNELAKRLKAMPELSGVVLVAVSGYSQEDDRARAQESGFDHYFVKPVELEALEALLDRIVAKMPKQDA